MIARAWHSVWDEPRVANAPARVWRDWVLVGFAIAAAVVETAVRPDVTWRPVAAAACIVFALCLLWRRTHPLVVVLVVFGGATVLDLAASGSSPDEAGLYTTVFALVLPYALCRWGSGRAIVVGLAFTLGTHALREVVYGKPTAILVGVAFLLIPAALGLTVRFAATARSRQVDEYRLLEREQLARELHDTVAHHVSAIAIQAQAARVVAETRPEAVGPALRAIESEASLALAEMRAMVGALRDASEVDLAPARGVADIPGLAHTGSAGPVVRAQVEGLASDLPPALDAAVYRIAQESVTNARRHARNATIIDVRVEVDEAQVRVRVVDDGDPAAGATWGYGLVGMTERAAILGGSMEAGPAPDRGWIVTATLPRGVPR